MRKVKESCAYAVEPIDLKFFKMSRFLAKQPKFRDVESSGDGSEGTGAVEAARIVVTGGTEGARSVVNMNDGQIDLIETDLDICLELMRSIILHNVTWKVLRSTTGF